MKTLRDSVLKFLLDLTEIVFISASITVLTFLFLAQPLKVTGDSMEPTFMDGEQLIVEKVSIKYKDLERGEVAIFKHPENPAMLLIKRVVGLPGDTILLQDGDILINGQIYMEQYLKGDALTWGKNYIVDGEELTLSDNEYVLLGDNRENSLDSRSYGPVSEENIVGRSFVVYLPLGNIRIVQ